MDGRLLAAARAWSGTNPLLIKKTVPHDADDVVRQLEAVGRGVEVQPCIIRR